MELKTLKDIEVSGKKVLVRADLDVGKDFGGEDRLEVLLPTLNYLSKKSAKIILLGHMGRPGGKEDPTLSLKPAAKKLDAFLKENWGEDRVAKLNMYVMENLRFNLGEESNDEHYAEHLAEEGEVYVNEAFATSHRRHASIVGLPLFLRSKNENSVAAGFHFVEEVENLGRVLENPKRPLVSIISGIKKDKLSYVADFKKFSDKILIAGRLPDYLGDNKDGKLKVANLTPDKEDITIHSMELFEAEISKAKTIVVSGPMGKFEDEGHRQGTQRVLKAVSESSAYKVAGGGDTQRAIKFFGLSDKFDWISVGGGAMLEFLAKGSLPGIDALLAQD